MVAPTIKPTAERVVLARFSLVTKRTMNAETAVDGVCSAIEITVTATTPATIRRVIVSRPGGGDNSRRNQKSQSATDLGERLAARALMPLARRRRRLDYRDGGCAHAEQSWVRVFNFDPHRKPLGDLDPIQLALDVRQP